MRKKFKSKKKLKFKNLVYLFLIIFLIIIFKCYILKIKLINSNEKLVTNILDNINYYSYNGVEENNIVSKIYSYINDNVFNSPENLLKNQLYYQKISQESESKVIKQTQFLYGENDPPRIYIYNSHQGENYSYKYLEDYNIIPNVLMASSMLKDKLEKINIPTLVEKNDILEYMKSNDLDHSESYIASRYFLEKAINKYNSIDLFIDLHRDAAPHSVTYTEINGKPCAKVLFVIGLEYSTYENNLAIVTDINNIILEKYPTLTRGIMKKEGYGVNGVYNQDLADNVILIEIGGHENNIDEINNTLDLIAEVIGEYLNEKEEKK